MTHTAYVFFACLLCVPLAAAAPQLRLSVRNVISFAPADLEIRVHAEPGGRGREVLVELAGPEFYRSSLLPIRADPDAISLQPPVWYRSIPAGEYLVTATLSQCAARGCATRVVLMRKQQPIEVLGVQP